jgi:hypothetical protein
VGSSAARCAVGMAPMVAVAVASLSGTSAAGAAGGGSGDDKTRAALATLDYSDDLVTPEEMARVPAFEPVLPLTIEQSAPFASGDDLPTLCGGRDAGVITGHKVDMSTLPGVDLAYSIVSVDSAKTYLRQARREIKECQGSYPSGNLTLTPVADQPVLKLKPRDLAAVLATTIESSGNSAFQVAVRAKDVKHFVAYYVVVASTGVVTMTERDLATLAALGQRHVNELGLELDQARKIAEAKGE